MIHPATELRFISPEIGFGVFATEPIPRGTILWVLCRFDLVMSPQEAAAMPPPYQPILDRYAYIDGAGRTILCWDFGRYVNHHCDPVMLGAGTDFEIAVRDIAAGEELTCEYACLNLVEPMACRCGSPHCRGVIDSRELAALSPAFDRRVADALPHARAVPQPLLAYAENPGQFWQWVDGRKAPPGHAANIIGQVAATG